MQDIITVAGQSLPALVYDLHNVCDIIQQREDKRKFKCKVAATIVRVPGGCKDRAHTRSRAPHTGSPVPPPTATPPVQAHKTAFARVMGYAWATPEFRRLVPAALPVDSAMAEQQAQLAVATVPSLIAQLQSEKNAHAASRQQLSEEVAAHAATRDALQAEQADAAIRAYALRAAHAEITRLQGLLDVRADPAAATLAAPPAAEGLPPRTALEAMLPLPTVAHSDAIECGHRTALEALLPLPTAKRWRSEGGSGAESSGGDDGGCCGHGGGGGSGGGGGGSGGGAGGGGSVVCSGPHANCGARILACVAAAGDTVLGSHA